MYDIAHECMNELSQIINLPLQYRWVRQMKARKVSLIGAELIEKMLKQTVN